MARTDVPDEDNGGNGLNALQLMLMQSEGRKILLLPAWPKNWSARFQLHAPGNTTVAGTVRDGKLEMLRVNPEDRLKDIEWLTPDGTIRKVPDLTERAKPERMHERVFSL